jgi:hypothetical protein
MAHLISAQLISPEGWLATEASPQHELQSTEHQLHQTRARHHPEQPDKSTLVCNGFQPEHAARGCIRPNIHRRSRPAAFVCRTRLPKTSALLQHIRQNSRLGQMMWTALQWTQVTVESASPSSPNLEALTSRRSRPLVTFST